MKIKTIAVLGVDGSGKSTAVSNLVSIYGDKCIVTYMGYKDFEDPKIEKLKGKRFATPAIVLRIYRCFWKRYLNAAHTGKIAIFDRYIHEIFINAGGRLKKINILLYKYLFPRPSRMVYLYCEAEESLKRKSDIEDADEFIEMKKRFDDYFLNRKGVLCLDSGVLTPEEITDRICDFINKSFDK